MNSLSLSLSWDLLLILLSFLGLQILKLVPVFPPPLLPICISQAFKFELNYTAGFPGSPAHRQQIVEFLSPTTVGAIPISNLSHIPICILLLLFLWRTLIHPSFSSFLSIGYEIPIYLSIFNDTALKKTLLDFCGILISSKFQ